MSESNITIIPKNVTIIPKSVTIIPNPTSIYELPPKCFIDEYDVNPETGVMFLIRRKGEAL
jgi:hypothetical protein